MLEKSFGLYFFLKQPKQTGKKERYVYMRITVDGCPVEMSTKMYWLQERWCVKSGRAVGNKEDARGLNATLDTLTSKVYQAKRLLMERNEAITAGAIKSVLLGKEKKKRMVLDIFATHNAQMKELIGREYAPGTFQRFETSLEHTRSFIKWKYKSEDFPLEDLDYEFISEYSVCIRRPRIVYLGFVAGSLRAVIRKFAPVIWK